MQRIRISNGHVITPAGIIPNGTVLVEGTTIAAIGDKNLSAADAREIDANGKYIAPGFIDIHVHGGGGYDFMDGDASGFLKIAETHARFGTTGMMPTTLSCSK